MNHNEEFQRAQEIVARLCADPEVTRDMVATAYVSVLVTSLATEDSDTDVTTANTAILERWSKSALAYIKDRAWKVVQAARSDAEAEEQLR